MLRLFSYFVFRSLYSLNQCQGRPPRRNTSFRANSLLEFCFPVPVLTIHIIVFRTGHSTVQQCHRVVRYITESIEEKKACAAVFLDIQQAFDKVWHAGLLYKIKKNYPTKYTYSWNRTSQKGRFKSK
jgi:hypothetical protein